MNRRILVTGAASGLGNALVERFSDARDRVLATDLSLGRPGSLPEGVDYLPLDVTSDANWEAAHDHVTQEWGGLDLLVNNAGIASGGRIDVATMDEWELVTEVDLLGVVRGCRAFAPTLKAQGSGHIVNVASLAGLVHPPGMAAYNAAKAGVVALTETLHHELAPYGVAASVVCPSYFRTNLASSLKGADTDVLEKAAGLIESSPLSVAEVADAVVEGIERREPVILPDEAARASYALKLADREAYDERMQVLARRLQERGTGQDG